MSGSIYEQSRLYAGKQLGDRGLDDQLEGTKQKNNFRVVINVANDESPSTMMNTKSKDGEQVNPIDAAPTQTNTLAGQQFRQLKNVDSVQHLDRDQDINFADGFDDASLYNIGDNAKSPSTMMRS